MTADAARVFLLSPAHMGGERGKMVLREEARFELAVRLRSAEGAPIGEVFAFVSGLYFRGKLAYAQRFAPRAAVVITPSEGLWPVDAPVGVEALQRFAEVDIHHAEPRFVEPLERDARKIARAMPGAEVVLLGSIASQKYVDVLTRVFGERLLFPIDFIGRGDMSRGGLMLRAARAGVELAYAPVLGTHRHGPRPPKLEKVTNGESSRRVTKHRPLYCFSAVVGDAKRYRTDIAPSARQGRVVSREPGSPLQHLLPRRRRRGGGVRQRRTDGDRRRPPGQHLVGHGCGRLDPGRRRRLDQPRAAGQRGIGLFVRRIVGVELRIELRRQLGVELRVRLGIGIRLGVGLRV